MEQSAYKMGRYGSGVLWRVRERRGTAVREPAYYHRRAVLVTMMKITDVGRSGS